MELICAHSKCGKKFVPNTHNQKYCSSECCKAETNAKIMKRYYENRARKKGAARACLDCGAGLSRYNPGKVCAACTAREEAKENNNLLGLIMAMGK